MKNLIILLVLTFAAFFTVSAQVNEDFSTVTEKATINLDGWINHIEAGSKDWIGGLYHEELYAYFNAYNSGDDSNESWLITPGVNLDEFTEDSLKFDLAYGYFVQADPLAIKYSLDFDGKEADIAKATWVDITDKCNIPTQDLVTSTFTPFIHTSLNIDDLSGTIYVAFVGTGSGNNSQTTAVELDNVVVGNPKPQSRILSFTVPHQLLSTKFDVQNASLSLTVYPGTDVTALVPEMEISEGAQVSPTMGSPVDFSKPAKFHVVSSDGGSVTDWTATVDILSDTPTTIHDLQYVSDPETSDASAFVGLPILTTGVVTYGTGSGSGYIQAGEGEWNGIYVYVGSSVTNISLSKGDSVLIYGTVSEYHYLTEFAPDSISVIADRKSVSPITVTAPLTENVEGVLVKVSSLTVKTTDTDGTYYGITSSNDTVMINNSLFDGLALTDGDTYDITGIVTSSYNDYTLCPRSTSDVEGGSAVNSNTDVKLSVYPNPVSGMLYIDGAASKNVQVYNVLGTVVKTVEMSGNSIDVSSLSKGVYLLSVDSKVIRFVKE